MFSSLFKNVSAKWIADTFLKAIIVCELKTMDKSGVAVVMVATCRT